MRPPCQCPASFQEATSVAQLGEFTSLPTELLRATSRVQWVIERFQILIHSENSQVFSIEIAQR